jgi:DNA invertase Pin-like site-specific DNA recombinase
MRCLPPASTFDICLRIKPPVRRGDRTGLAQALEFIRLGDVLVVWKLDRLGRSLSHLLAIVNSLKDKQVAFRSLTEGMDTNTGKSK